MYKSYVFRLYPNKEQEELINKAIGAQDLFITIIWIRKRNYMNKIKLN